MADTNNVSVVDLTNEVNAIYDTVSQISSSCAELQGILEAISNSSICQDGSSEIADGWRQLASLNADIGQVAHNYANDLKNEIDNYSKSTQSTNTTQEATQERTKNVFKEKQDAISRLKNRV